MGMRNSTLCYLENPRGEYLMLHRVKKKADINKGKWIGVGGGFEEGESPDECLRREVWEETNLTLTEFQFRGVVTFLCCDSESDQFMYLFTATGWTGELTDDCNEGDLAWVPKEKVTQLPIWEGDAIFLDLLAQDAPPFLLTLDYRSDSGQDRLVRAVLNGKELPLNEGDVHPMKFSEMPYERPDLEALKGQLSGLAARLKAAGSYEEAKAVFLEKDQESRHVDTLATLAQVRNTIDTRDSFYDGEVNFWNAALPELEEYEQAWKQAMLDSPFRKDFEAEYGSLMFVNTEIALKTFSPDIVPQLQRENDLTQEYQKLIAAAQVPFEGKTYTLSQMTPFQNDPDDQRRLAAWKAVGQWFKEHQADLDRIYDQLTHLRDEMGKKLGYEGYTTLGYYRMGRNCYTKEDVERFRAAVRKYLVPLADRVFRVQAERIGVEYPLSYADSALKFRSGNPRPVGTANDILAQGKRFYDELSPETSEFFQTMLDQELMDVLSTEGKAGGGYCTAIADYKVPFIFANFNGTQGDVDVITHEAGHAFACWMNRDRVPSSYTWPSSEACEVHSMSMEFMAWPWIEGFFGPDARKYLYSHLAGALTFIPYGTLVDHFQHEVYANPGMTPAQRHAKWKELQEVYMPWVRLDGDIPFFSEGEAWQRQMHIYDCPFYYIDYCLAQTVALEFWALLQKDRGLAWEKYMAYTREGGSRTFTELLKNAQLDSPFDENCLRSVCEAAGAWLDEFDLSGIE